MTSQAQSFPTWLHLLAIAMIGIGIACALVLAFDCVRHPQKMGIMNLVWPLSALFGGPVWVWLYWRFGRSNGQGIDQAGEIPFWASVAKGASHCGAGCTLGDLIAEWAAFALPTLAVWFGWRSIFAEKTFAVWILDFVLAFGLGVVFQYFTIKPMRDLTVKKGIVQAIKADTASITSWQVGMYGAMALAQFVWLAPRYGGIAPVNSPEFWAIMQVAMLCGFATAYPVNWWLIRSGMKERM